MTTTTPSPARNRIRQGRPTLPRSPGAGGFTLVELMIGASLASFILAGVLSTFLFMGRSGANVNNYNDMEAQARKALEYFAEDTRQASGVVWSDANTVALTVGSLRVTNPHQSPLHPPGSRHRHGGGQLDPRARHRHHQLLLQCL